EISPVLPHLLQHRTEHIKVATEPLARSTQEPDTVVQSPSAVAVGLTKLGLVARDDYRDRNTAFLRIANQLPDVGFRNGGLIFVVDQHSWLKLRTSGVPKAKNVVPVFGELFANADSRPCPHLFLEAQFLQLAPSCRFGDF